MPKEPSEDSQFFVRLALDAVSHLHFTLDLHLRDLKADRGPYAFTGRTFFCTFEHEYKQALMFAVVKLNYAPVDNTPAMELCKKVERAFEQYRNVILKPIQQMCLSKWDILHVLGSEKEACTSLLSKLDDHLPGMESLCAELRQILDNWENSQDQEV